MRRILLLSVLLLLAALSFAQDLNQKVTYRAEALPLKTVCDELSEKTGVKLSIAGPIGSMIMVIDVHDVVLNDLMNRMASTVEAEWVQERGGARLTRTSTFLRKKEEEAFQRRLAKIVKSQAKLKEKLSKTSGFTKQVGQGVLTQVDALQKEKTDENNQGKLWQTVQKIENTLPKSRLVNYIASTLDPQMLAKLKPGDRLVLSTRPNKMQQILAGTVAPHVQRFIQEQNIWADLLSGLPEPDYDSEDTSWTVNQLLADRDQIDAQPGKVLVILTAAGQEGMISVDLRLLSTKNKTMTSADCYLGNSNDEEEEEDNKAQRDEYVERFTKLQEEAAKEPPVKLNPLAEEFCKIVSWGRMGEKPEESQEKPMSAALKDALLHPEKVDPLKLGVTDLLFDLAEHRKLQLVCAPPDFLLFYVAMSNAQTTLKSSYIFGMMTEMAGESNPFWMEDSWFLGKRGDFTSVEMFPTVDRTNLGKIARQIYQDGRITLDTQCQIALIDDSGTFPGLYMLYPSILISSGNFWASLYGDRESSDRDMLRLHGLLTPSQKQTLAGGGKIMIGNLTPAQREVLFDMVFKPRGYGTLGPDQDEEAGSDSGSDVPQEVDVDWDEIQFEPTEKFPNGLPLNGFITLKLETEDAVVAEMEFGERSSYTRAMDPEELGYYLAQKESPSNGSEEEEYYRTMEFKSFQTALKTNWNYKISFAPDAIKNAMLSDTKPVGSKVNQIDQLPRDLVQTIMKAKEEMLKEIKEQQQRPPDDGGGGGGGGLLEWLAQIGFCTESKR